MIKNLYKSVVLLFMTWVITSFVLMEIDPLKWSPLGRLILVIVAIVATNWMIKDKE
jgi:hypothetical protein